MFPETDMPNDYLTDMKNRLLAMCLECIPNSDASADPLFVGTTIPYWVVTVDDYEPTEDSEEISIRPYIWTIQYILGPITAGYDHELSDRLYAEEPKILNYFMSRRDLQSAKYPRSCDHLQPGTVTQFNRSAGLGAYNRTAINQMVYGTVFQLRATIAVNIPLLY